MLRLRIAALEHKLGEREEHPDDIFSPPGSPIEKEVSLGETAVQRVPTPPHNVEPASPPRPSTSVSPTAALQAAPPFDLDHAFHLGMGLPSSASLSLKSPFPSPSIGGNFQFTDPNPTDLGISPMIQADLEQLYFDRTHVFMTIIHRGRYFQRSRSRNINAPFTCLQGAMFTMAAALSSQFQHLRDDLYNKTIQLLNMGPGKDEASRLEHAQAWTLVSVFEFMQYTFHRAWMSAGRAIRLVQLMQLKDIDSDAGQGTNAGEFLDKEEKRRTFWAVFCLDRLSCLMEGLPLTLSEQTICTRLPAPESAFQGETPVLMPFLHEMLAEHDGDQSLDPNFTTAENAALFSPFMGYVLFTTLLSRANEHHQRVMALNPHSIVPAELGDMHKRLHDLVARHVTQFQHIYPQSSVKTDPMLLFTMMLAQNTFLALCKTAELLRATISGYEELKMGEKCTAASASGEIARLARFLPHFGLFKVHPFSPIPLQLCFQHLSSLSQDGGRQEDMETICSTLYELRGVNRLCQDQLDPSFGEMELPCFDTDGANDLLNFFDKDTIMM